MATEKNCALLLAAGSGTRMQGEVEDKVLTELRGSPVFTYSLRAFAACRRIDMLCIVYRDEAQRQQFATTLDNSIRQEIVWTQGGKARQDSVLSGLKALPADTTHTLIHDCARPLITTSLIELLIKTTRHDGAACLAQPVKDTIKRIPTAGELIQTHPEDLERDRLWAMQTPQAFRHADILKAYQHVAAKGLQITDDCAAAASIGIKTTLIHNLAPNPKITTADDLDYISWLLNPDHH